VSCITNNTSRRSGRAFCIVTAMFLLLSLAIFIFGLMHRSEQPWILGRYSSGYAALLLGLFVIVLYFLWVFLKAGPRLQRWTGNLYVLLISSLVILLAIEWGLRAFNPFGVEFFDILPYHMQGMVDDSQLGYRHPRSVEYMLGKNQVKINAHGLRDEEIPFTKPEDEKRILVLGDSVAFGWGVSQGETFSDRMEPLLQQQTGTRWQVINAGVNGYNSEQEAAYLRIEGIRYSPDFILLIYVSNDVDEVLEPNVTTWRRYPTWPPNLPEALNRLKQRSYLLQLTHLFIRMNKMDQARAAASIEGGAPSGRKNRSMTDHPNWLRSKEALLDIARQSREASIPFLVGLYSSLDSGFDPAFIVDLQDAGIDAMPLQPAWKDIPENVSYVSRIDSHPNALVHQSIAEYLVKVFRQRGWLDDGS